MTCLLSRKLVPQKVIPKSFKGARRLAQLCPIALPTGLIVGMHVALAVQCYCGFEIADVKADLLLDEAMRPEVIPQTVSMSVRIYPEK